MNKTKSFEFKQFKIEGGYSGMPVSTDGVMLGAWIDLAGYKSLLDIGTGTGLLALMCAQRSHLLNIEAIDIEQNAIEAAQANFDASAWSDRLTLHHADVLKHPFKHSFEAIICNPPYFNSGEQAANSSRAVARHTSTLEHSRLLKRCWSLLSDNGCASFVLPIVEGEQFIDIAKTQGWQLKRHCSIQPTPNKPVSRILFELSKQPVTTHFEQLTIHQDNGYSAEFIDLTKDFYLKM
ncbi:tRNA1(Val) (adenine(37)-N6)-methyltransferase [Vibrio brasiliensis]|uniref:tRNA1(Val) (adenine(37)-N6)-methyltransferase n=1 Tax=Vibrio brasiliensis LMG 20546 TaxID=945543 RepID=E8LPP3_9VIBR|nr:methyltransferase [Vibrio brasiliensis]EGA67339.1 tRNA (adenine-N(6)-)-methyltransferase [Vibrio brasiliensis LMG 20546]